MGIAADRLAGQPFPMPIGLHKPGQQPLYLFHDGSGKTGMYERLALSGYNLFGIYSLDFEQVNPAIQTLEALAALYIEKAHLMEVQNAIFGGMFAPAPTMSQSQVSSHIGTFC